MNQKSFLYFTTAFVFGLTYRLFNSEPQISTALERPAEKVSPNFAASLPKPPLKVAHSMAELNETITHLDLTNHHSDMLSSEIFKHKQLKIITLNNCKLNYLPKEIAELTNLEALYLQNNQLQSLPVEIAHLTHLNILNLNDNQLKNLPKELCELSNLRTLYLKNNQLNKLPVQIGNLSNLVNLDLDGNQLKTLPVSFCKLMLSQRNISKNPFGILPDCVRYN